MLTDRKYIIARKWSNLELRKVAPLFSGEVANISAWDDRDKEGGKYRQYFKNCSDYYRTNYQGYRGFKGEPGEIELDLTFELPDELRYRFDVVFNHTTFEHIYEVLTAFSNFCEMSRDVAIIVVPFCQIQHESDSYGDYWRFTPSCLRKMFHANGMTTIYEAESPHKDAAIYLFFVASRHPGKHISKMPLYRPIRRAGRWIGANLAISAFQFASYRLKKHMGLINEEGE